MPNISRLTLFKIPEAVDVQMAVDKFSSLSQDAVKVSGDMHYCFSTPRETHPISERLA
jgi:hypothetical protein